MKIVSVYNPFKGYTYTCPHCGTKFKIETSDVPTFTYKPVTLIERNWYTLRLDPHRKIPFVDCGSCRKPVPLQKVVIHRGNGEPYGTIEKTGERI